jgi:hypothetical protein
MREPVIISAVLCAFFVALTVAGISKAQPVEEILIPISACPPCTCPVEASPAATEAVEAALEAIEKAEAVEVQE